MNSITKNVSADLETVPCDTPWGPLQTATQLIDGLWLVSTSQHEGIWLAQKRVLQLPPWASQVNDIDSSQCWYGLDSKIWLPIIAFAEELSTLDRWAGSNMTGQQVVEYAQATLLEDDWTLYEKVYGVTVLDGQSRARDQKIFEERYRDHYIATKLHRYKEAPAGYWVVSGRRSRDGAERKFLVTHEEYSRRRETTKAENPTLLLMEYRLVLGKPSHIPLNPS
jgi:hypothetical protein